MSQRTRSHTTDAATRKPRSKSPDTALTTAAKPPAKSIESDARQLPQVAASVVSQPTPPQATEDANHLLAPSSLARTLRAVAAELERDPDLARRVAASMSSAGEQPSVSLPGEPSNATTTPTAAPDEEAHTPASRVQARTFRPRLITGVSPDIGPGVPDPFALYAKRGEQGLQAVLDELRLGALRAIVREHALDPGGKLSRLNDAEKLRELILAAAVAAQPSEKKPPSKAKKTRR